MNKNNKEYYQQVYNSVNASSELKERLINMGERNRSEKQSKKKCIKIAGKVAVAVAAVSLLVPTGAYAYERIAGYFRTEVKKDGYQVDMKVEKTDTSSAEPDSIAVKKDAKSDTILAKKDAKPVKLVYDSMEGYSLGDKTGKGRYEFITKEGWESGKVFLVELLQVDVDTSKDYFVDDVSYSQNITVGGNRGIYIQRNQVVGSKYNKDTAYTQRVVVFYEDLGYILHFYAQSGIKKEQLIEYVNKITIENCKKQEESEAAYLSKQLNNADIEKTGIAWVKPEQLVKIKEPVVYDGIEYEVLNVDIKDNIAKEMKDIAKQIGHNENAVSVYAKKDGTLKSYDRETIKTGDGKNAPSASASKTENVGQKFVLVTLRVKNTTKKTVNKQVCKELAYFTKENGKTKVDYTEYRRPEAIKEVKTDAMPCYFKETDGGKGVYFKKLNAGEEAVYHIGYMVDEDQLSRMALQLDDGTDGYINSKFIDIKK